LTSGQGDVDIGFHIIKKRRRDNVTSRFILFLDKREKKVFCNLTID